MSTVCGVVKWHQSVSYQNHSNDDILTIFKFTVITTYNSMQYNTPTGNAGDTLAEGFPYVVH